VNLLTLNSKTRQSTAIYGMMMMKPILVRLASSFVFVNRSERIFAW